jgi:metal-sulfur cluster biosynthetic enzyme
VVELIYGIQIFPLGNVEVIITLTSPACPAAEQIPEEIASAIKKVDGVQNVHIEISFEPPYDISMMSETARYELGFI